jgi:hypothetical protein
MLKELAIHNYKSIREVDLKDLPPLSILVGANAAGKSNFADALDFLSLIFRTNLPSAVRAKGGYENICFRRGKRSIAGLKFGLKVITSQDSERPSSKKQKGNFTFSYDFSFSTPTQAITSDYEVTSENIEVIYESERPDTKAVIRVNRSKDRKPELFRTGKLRAEELGVTVQVIDYIIKNVAIAPDELFLTTIASRFGGLPPKVQRQSVPWMHL